MVIVSLGVLLGLCCAAGAASTAQGPSISDLLSLAAPLEESVEVAERIQIQNNGDCPVGNAALAFDVAGHFDQLSKIVKQRLAGASSRGIAIVGSSGNLLHSGLGPAIDSHGVIIRCNGAPTSGYEGDVGSTVTLLLVNGQEGLESARKVGHRPQAVLEVPYEIQGNKAQVEDGLGGQFMGLSIKWVKDMHINQLQSNGRWPSTGFVATALGMALGSFLNVLVDVYGFGDMPTCIKYYECQARNIYTQDFTMHNPAVEHQVIKKWAIAGKLSLDHVPDAAASRAAATATTAATNATTAQAPLAATDKKESGAAAAPAQQVIHMQGKHLGKRV